MVTLEKTAKARARAPRKDPVQEQIVSSKDSLNERMSKLIEILKEFKRGWNGGPAPKIGLPEKINLTSPLPAEVVSAGQASLQELASILEGVRQVDSMQDNYSNAKAEARAKRQQETRQAALEAELYKFASNPLTRTWARIVAPFSSEKGRWERIELLKSLARMNRSIKEIDEKVLGGEPLDALHLAKQLYMDAMSSFFKSMKKNLDETLQVATEEAEKLKHKAESVEVNRPVQPTISGPVRVEPKGEQAGTGTGTGTQPAPQVTAPQTVSDKPEDPAGELLGAPAIGTTKADFETQTDLIPASETPPVAEPAKPRSKPRKKPTYSEYIEKAVRILYKKAVDDTQKESNIPDPWHGKVSQNWNSINTAVESIWKSQNTHDLVLNYLVFIKEVGYLLAMLEAFGFEKQHKQIDPDFEFGATLDEEALERISQEFVISKQKELATKVASDNENSMIVQGSDASRWVKRMLTHLSFNRDKNVRIQIDRNLRSARQALQTLMDTLEKRDVNFRTLISQSDVLYGSLINAYEQLADLGDMYNSRMRIEKSVKKQNQERMPYDFIPITDITAMRNIKNSLESDQKNIKALEDIESTISALQAQINKTTGANG